MTKSNINKLILLNDVNRLKNRNSLAKLIVHQELISSDSNISFRYVMDKIKESFELSTLKETELLGLVDNINTGFLKGDKQLERKNKIIEGFIVESLDEKSKVLNTFLTSLQEQIKIEEKNKSLETNHNKLITKANIENFMVESKMINCEEYAIEGIFELCDTITTIYDKDLNERQKIGVCMESISYACNKLKVPLTSEQVLFFVTEYFLLNDRYNIDTIESVLEATKVFSSQNKQRTKKRLTKMKEDKITNPVTKKTYGDEIELEMPILEAIDKQTIKDVTSELLYDIRTSKIAVKGADAAKKITNILYKTKKEDILDETPNVLGFIRRVILYGGAIAISPYLVLPVIVVDTLLHQKVNKDSCDKMIKQLEREKKKTEKQIYKNPNKKDDLNKYMDTLDKQIERITEYRNNMFLDKETEEDYQNENMIEPMAIILAIGEMVDEVYLHEGTAATLARTAKEKLAKATEKLSTKEKVASRTLDTNIERFIRATETAVTVKERERVIKGSVLPSASKTIKLAIAAGAAWAINPAIAIVGTLAALAMAKTANARERQMILDEIDIHLKIVEKKVQQAEMNNDTKAIEDLLRLENRLKREKQRIKYRMKVYHNQQV